MKRFLISIATLLAFTSVWGQSKVSPFTAHYIHGQQAVTRSAAVDDVVNVYLHTVGIPDMEALENLGVKVGLQVEGIMTARIPVSAIGTLAQLDFIRYIQMGTPVRDMMDKARAVSLVDPVLAGEGLDMPYTGKGVVVGIIDGGFDYTHPAFYDTEGNLRIKRVWEQGTTEGEAPVGFGYGVELTTEEAILAAGADVKNQSHGTHVAAMAAGAFRTKENPYYGVAPEADIVLVSKGNITANCANISDAIAYIYNYADAVGKPCVINMSLGWHQGPHDGTSAFDQVADQLQGPGRILVGSMGNYGNDAVHVSKTFTGADDTPLKSMVSYKITPSKSNVGGEIDIWADAGMDLDLKVVVTRTSDGSEMSASEVMSLSAAEGKTQEFKLSGRISGNVLITTEVNPLNGKPHAFLTLGVESRAMGMTVGIVIMPRSAGTVHAWTDAVYTTFETEDVPEGWMPGDKERTLCEIGGTGKNIISVGAYVSSETYVELGTSQTKRTDETLGALATFSSVGPTIDGRMKPDVVAPGTFIVSAVNSYDSYKSSYPTASAVVWNDRTYNYSYMQGTSMAAPFVSGVVATWLQAYPQLDCHAIRDILQKTAKNDEFTTSSTCGHGKIDAYAGLKEVLALVASVEDVVADEGASVTLRLSDDGVTLCFARPSGSVDIQLYDAVGSLLDTYRVEVAEAGETFSVPFSKRAHGLYLLRVGTEVYKIVRK